MIQELLNAAKTDLEVRSILNVAVRAGQLSKEQAAEFGQSYGVEFEG